MKSKRFPDRVHVVRPPSEEYGGEKPLNMGDHTREIVRALAQISDKLKRSEVERVEVLKELRATKEALANMEDRSELNEKAYLSLEHKMKNTGSVGTEVTERQARFEKALKATEEKLVKAAAGQAVLDQKIRDSATVSATLNARIDEAVAQQTRMERRIEGVAQDKARMLRKVERLEEIVTETQDALRAKALVLLTDQSAAAQTPAIGAPDWYDAQNRNDNLTEDRPWWKAPVRMQALGTASMVLAALLTGWMINHVQEPNVPQIAVVDGNLARLSDNETQWEPIVLQNERVESDRFSALGQTEQQNLEESLASTQTPVIPQNIFEEDTVEDQSGMETISTSDLVSEEPVQQQAPAQEEAIPEPQAEFDYTDDSQLMEALEEDPQQLAANLNAIEPGIPPIAKEAPTPISTPITQEAPIRDFEKQAFTQEPAVANAVKNEGGLAPLSDRVERDPNLPDLIKEYEEQAIRGVAAAQHDLAAVYTAGKGGVDQDFEKAAFWFKEAATNGVDNAAYNLGVLYHQGLGVDQDLSKAIYWYREAAKQNHPEALYNLGIAHIEGIGTPYNPELAAGFFERSANGGIMEAAYNLGLIYENGLLGQENPEEALLWYKIAADQGSSDAQEAMTKLARRLQIGQQDIDNMVAREQALRANNTAPAAGAVEPVAAETSAYGGQQAILAQVQERLITLGLYPGPSDGIMGPKTADAIRTYQSENGMEVTGKSSKELLLHMMQRGL